MRRDPKIREILSIFSSLFHLETLRPWLPVEQSASLWPLAQQGYRERRRRRSGCIIFCCWFLDEARVSDAFEIKRLVGCTVSGARTPSWTGGGRRGEERGEEGWTSPLATTATKTENVVKLRNILSTLFTSGDKDRRGALSDPVLHPLEITGSDMALVSRRKKK